MARLRACMLVLALCLAMRAKCLRRYSRVLGWEWIGTPEPQLPCEPTIAFPTPPGLPIVWRGQLLDDVMDTHQAFILPRH